MVAHSFAPGDRLRSKRSGRVWYYAPENPTPPPGLEAFIPIRDELWAPPYVIWQKPDIFEKVDDDYLDTAKSDFIV